jgi:hypothetical protein
MITCGYLHSDIHVIGKVAEMRFHRCNLRAERIGTLEMHSFCRHRHPLLVLDRIVDSGVTRKRHVSIAPLVIVRGTKEGLYASTKVESLY